jgi:hypothetical protein
MYPSFLFLISFYFLLRACIDPILLGLSLSLAPRPSHRWTPAHWIRTTRIPGVEVSSLSSPLYHTFPFRSTSRSSATSYTSPFGSTSKSSPGVRGVHVAGNAYRGWPRRSEALMERRPWRAGGASGWIPQGLRGSWTPCRRRSS